MLSPTSADVSWTSSFSFRSQSSEMFLAFSRGGLTTISVVVTLPTLSNQSSSLVTVVEPKEAGTEAGKTCRGSTIASLAFTSTVLVAATSIG